MGKLYRNNSNLFGQNLSHYRRLCGLTQDHLGQAVGVSRTYISALEHGRANPTLKLMSTRDLVLNTEVEIFCPWQKTVFIQRRNRENEIHKNARHRK